MLIVHLVDALFATAAEHPLISAARQAEQSFPVQASPRGQSGPLFWILLGLLALVVGVLSICLNQFVQFWYELTKHWCQWAFGLQSLAPDPSTTDLVKANQTHVLAFKKLQLVEGDSEISCEHMNHAFRFLMFKPWIELLRTPANLLQEFSTQSDFRILISLEMPPKQSPASWSHDSINVVSQLQQPAVVLPEHGQ